MSLATNIIKRKGSSSYYLRLAVPADLQERLGRRDIWRSLRTTDPKEARKRARAAHDELENQFARVRSTAGISPVDIRRAAQSFYEAELTHDLDARARLPTSADIAQAKEKARAEFNRDPSLGLDVLIDVATVSGAADYERDRRRRLLATLRTHAATGDTVLVEWAADQAIERDRLPIRPGTPAYRALALGLLRAWIESLERAEERDRGVYGGKPSDKLLTAPAKAGETIMELFERFRVEKAGSVTADTMQQNGVIVALFADFIGTDEHISAVNGEALRDFKAALFSWPVKAADTNAFAGMGFKQIIEANRKVKKPTISAKTINKYLSAVGPFLRWLRANRYIAGDVTLDDLYLDIDKSKKNVVPYSADQLQKLFASPLFGLCRGDGKEHVGGNVAVRDWRFWLPLIALYSGARLGEIAQLLADDLRQIRGHWCFHITPEGSADKTVKTEGSARVVPVHPELIRIGLLEYRAKMKEAGAARLFPEIRPDARGFISGPASKWMNTYFKRVGIKSDATNNFHSFRHGIADAFRRAGYLDEQFGPLLGHTKATTTQRYGILPEGELSHRVQMIEAVTFPGLDLSKITW